MASGKPDFFEELKRRHVWRVVIGYAVAGWLVVQIATQVFPFFNIPGSDVRLVVVLVLIGFPIALALAWAYEITPEGVRLTRPADAPDARPEHEIRQLGRKLNTIIVVVLIAAVSLLGWRLLALKRAAPASRPVAAAQAQPANRAMVKSAAHAMAAPAFNPPVDTLVVLPFADLGGNPKQQYFSDGITEELTNALGQNTALRVIAWDTASKYRDSKQSATDIAKALNVANVLTGKILRQGNEVRVIVELVNARTGYQTWSHHYDDSLANIFHVQDSISASIAGALKVKFAAANTQRTVNPQAYGLVQQARALIHNAGQGAAAPFERARDLLGQAIALDSDYAEAHALLARTWIDLFPVSILAPEEALSKARKEAHKALQLDPRNVDALIALGNADSAKGNSAQAKAEDEHALAIDPSNAGAHLNYGLLLPPKQALAQEQEAVRLDPGNPTAQNNLAVDLLNLGEYRLALAPSLADMKLTPHSADSAMSLAAVYALLHQNENAVKAFDLAKPTTELGKALVAAGRLAYRSALDPTLHAQALAAADTLHRRRDLDPTSQYDLMQVYLVLGRKDPALELLDKSCEPVPYSCNDLAINPTYIPLRGDPRFEALVKKYAPAPLPPTSGSTLSSSP